MTGRVYTSPESVVDSRDAVDIGAAVVAAARAWIGTPFRWQQSVRGRGCDCKGLIAGVARDIGRAEGASRFAAMADYRPGHVPLGALHDGLAELFDRVADARTGARHGDVLLLRVGGAAQHLAIVSAVDAAGPARMIHCYAKGPGRVIEVPTGHVWRDAIVATWRWKPA